LKTKQPTLRLLDLSPHKRRRSRAPRTNTLLTRGPIAAPPRLHEPLERCRMKPTLRRGHIRLGPPGIDYFIPASKPLT
jgi:hypothetical protein